MSTGFVRLAFAGRHCRYFGTVSVSRKSSLAGARWLHSHFSPGVRTMSQPSSRVPYVGRQLAGILVKTINAPVAHQLRYSDSERASMNITRLDIAHAYAGAEACNDGPDCADGCGLWPSIPEHPSSTEG